MKQESTTTVTGEISPSQIEDLLAMSTDYHKTPLKAEAIDGTPFYKNVLNLVYGLSKSGKSFSIAKVLTEAGLTGKDVIWLDKDYNINETLLSYLRNFTHINYNVEEFEEMLLEVNGHGKILIFDSLKDFLHDADIDSNAGSQEAMEYVRKFLKAGFTVIVIAHATLQKSSTTALKPKATMKIKGNEETIKSKSDIVFQLQENADYRSFKLTDSRITNAYKGSEFRLYQLQQLKELVEKYIKDSSELTVRELTNKLPSAVRDTFKANQDKLIKVEMEGKKHIAKCI